MWQSRDPRHPLLYLFVRKCRVSRLGKALGGISCNGMGTAQMWPSPAQHTYTLQAPHPKTHLLDLLWACCLGTGRNYPQGRQAETMKFCCLSLERVLCKEHLLASCGQFLYIQLPATAWWPKALVAFGSPELLVSNAKVVCHFMFLLKNVLKFFLFFLNWVWHASKWVLFSMKFK